MLVCSFVGESMHDEGTMVFAYYKEGATDPTFLYLAPALKEVKCWKNKSLKQNASCSIISFYYTIFSFFSWHLDLDGLVCFCSGLFWVSLFWPCLLGAYVLMSAKVYFIYILNESLFLSYSLLLLVYTTPIVCVIRNRNMTWSEVQLELLSFKQWPES